MEKFLMRTVQIDLALYKFETDALRDLGRGVLAFERMPSATYVLAKQSAPGLRPLVRERSQKDAVIFVSGDSGITNLSQLGGKRLALGQATSDCAFWGKVYLARLGVVSSTLRSCTYMRGGGDEPGNSDKEIVDRDPNLQAHKRVVQEVLGGRADVGIAPRRQFELSRYRKRGLVELYRFPVSSEIYVGSPELSKEVAQALQESFVSFNLQPDKEALSRLADSASSGGFEKITDEDFTSIRAALEHEIAEFDRTAEHGLTHPLSEP